MLLILNSKAINQIKKCTLIYDFLSVFTFLYNTIYIDFFIFVVYNFLKQLHAIFVAFLFFSLFGFFTAYNL